jgi:hypothetical protein
LPPGVITFGGPPPIEADNLSILRVGAQARWYPWRYAFVGASLGWQMWRDDANNFGHTFTYSTQFMYITPRVGVLYRFTTGWASGWELGGDMGLTFRVAAHTGISPYDGDQDAKDLTNGFYNTVTPELTVVRLGHVFTL